MKQQTNFSDELLNAYIDGEISTEDEISILEAMQQDTALVKRVNELKRVKLLVCSTYKTNSIDNSTSKNKMNIPLSFAASILLTIGILGGWSSHKYYTNNETSINIVSENNIPKDNVQGNNVSKYKTWNIVLHVNTNDEYIQKTILDETESLLESFKESNEKVKVEIVAYGRGVFLFDSEKSKYKDRLSSLKDNFSNLSYAVCGRTVKRLEKVGGRKINLISKMTVARSGIYQIIKRQKQGWNYIRI